MFHGYPSLLPPLFCVAARSDVCPCPLSPCIFHRVYIACIIQAPTPCPLGCMCVSEIERGRKWEGERRECMCLCLLKWEWVSECRGERERESEREREREREREIVCGSLTYISRHATFHRTSHSPWRAEHEYFLLNYSNVCVSRSWERRVGKVCRCRWPPYA